MDILSIDSLSDAQIQHILERAADCRRGMDSGQIAQSLERRIVFNLFYENSTRTLMSFATAAERLGARAIALPLEASSVKKGESFADTLLTLGAMQPDVLVIRHRDNGSAAKAADLLEVPVINAGDGTNEHPTQALLDAATLVDRFGDLHGRVIAICGDIKHSRVARSNAKLLERLGAVVRLAGPPALMPGDTSSLTIDEAVDGADAVMMLRVQRERLEDELGDQPGEFLRLYGLTPERMTRTAPNAVVMHPGPINRGVEIADTLADDAERSMILDQVAFGVATRMACLEMAAGVC